MQLVDKKHLCSYEVSNTEFVRHYLVRAANRILTTLRDGSLLCVCVEDCFELAGVMQSLAPLAADHGLSCSYVSCEGKESRDAIALLNRSMRAESSSHAGASFVVVDRLPTIRPADASRFVKALRSFQDQSCSCVCVLQSANLFLLDQLGPCSVLRSSELCVCAEDSYGWCAALPFAEALRLSCGIPHSCIVSSP